MPLSFLKDIGDFASQAAPAARGFGGLINAFRGNSAANKAFKQSQMPTSAEIEYQSLLEALTNPESAKFKSVADQEYKGGVDAFLEQLRLITQQSNRQLARGQRSAFFDPERMDERLNYLTTRGLPKIRQQSNEIARGNIQKSAEGYANLSKPQIARQTSALDYSRRNEVDRQANPLGIFGDILKSLQSFGQPQSAQQPGAFPWQQPGMARPGGGKYTSVGAWNV